MSLLGGGSDWATVWTVEIRFLAKPWIFPSSNAHTTFGVHSSSRSVCMYLVYLPGVSWPERLSYDLSPPRTEVTNTSLVPREFEVVDPTQGHVYLTFSLNY